MCNTWQADDSKRILTDSKDEADEGETSLQTDISPVNEATETTPTPDDSLVSRPNVLTTFDCAWYLPVSAQALKLYLFPAENLLPAWHSFALHPQLYAALHSQGFVSPTPIQSHAIPKAFAGRDVIGVAETVSVGPFSQFMSPFLWFSGLRENPRLWSTYPS